MESLSKKLFYFSAYFKKQKGLFKSQCLQLWGRLQNRAGKQSEFALSEFIQCRPIADPEIRNFIHDLLDHISIIIK